MEKDINLDAEARQEMIRRHVSGVPSFLIGDDLVVGLDKAQILKLVDHKVVECQQCHARLRVPIDRGPLKVTCPKCKNAFDWNPR